LGCGATSLGEWLLCLGDVIGVVVCVDVKELGCLFLCSSIWFIWLWLETNDEFCAAHVTLLHLELPNGKILFCFVAKNVRIFRISCVLDAHDTYRVFLEFIGPII